MDSTSWKLRCLTVGWVAGWLAGLLLRWLLGCLVGWLAGWWGGLVGWLALVASLLRWIVGSLARKGSSRRGVSRKLSHALWQGVGDVAVADENSGAGCCAPGAVAAVSAHAACWLNWRTTLVRASTASRRRRCRAEVLRRRRLTNRLVFRRS